MYTIKEYMLPAFQNFEAELPDGSIPVALISKGGKPALIVKTPKSSLQLPERTMQLFVVTAGDAFPTEAAYVGHLFIASKEQPNGPPLLIHILWKWLSEGGIVTA